jgi:hypothetical protein
MKLYFAGPLFTTPERTWNAEVVAALRAAGHEIADRRRHWGAPRAFASAPGGHRVEVMAFPP